MTDHEKYVDSMKWLFFGIVALVGSPLPYINDHSYLPLTISLVLAAIGALGVYAGIRNMLLHHTWWELTQIAGGGLVACVGLVIGLTLENPICAFLIALGMIGLAAGFGLARLRVQTSTLGGE